MPPKKAAKHHESKHETEKNLRRAYEHFGRVEILQRNSGADAKDVATLLELAQAEVQRDQPENAAELLRAAEHLSFAAALDGSQNAPASGALLAAIGKEFERLKTKAEEHGEKGAQATEQIYKRSLKIGRQAFADGAYHRALELVRAAEALTRCGQLDTPKKRKRPELNAGKKELTLSR